MASMKSCEIVSTDVVHRSNCGFHSGRFDGKVFVEYNYSTRKINCFSGLHFKTPGIFNQGRQITKIEIDFESESRECVKLRKNEGKLKSI